MTTFNWNITTGDSANSYQVSSVSNPFQTVFANVPMSLNDEGKTTEHYFFQFLLDKQVRPSSALTSNNEATICFYNGTTFQAFLYTKEAQNYPSQGMSDAQASYPMWPFAVRIEEVIGGGDDVPNCYAVTDNRIGAPVDSSTFTPQPVSNTCDCLYLNYIP